MFVLKSFALVLGLILFSLPTWAVPFKGQQLVISGPAPYAGEAAIKTFKKSQNIIDAAVTYSLVMSVTSPYFGALGGGGFAMIHMGSETLALDFRETAPKATHPNIFVDSKKSSTDGGLAVGTPGVVAGLWALHQKYGKLKWPDLFQDAIDLAEKGFLVSGDWVQEAKENQGRFNSAGKKYVFKENAASYKPGDLYKQPQLAKALRIIQEKGEKGFYSGVIAEDIAKTVQAEGGVLELTDFQDYKVRWLKPMETDFKGYHFYLMPPPSSGGVVLTAALHLIEEKELSKYMMYGADEIHLLAEIMSRAFRARNLLGDPDFNKLPLEKILSKDYLKELSDSISLTKSVQLPPLEEKENEHAETTNFSMMDNKGNAIALTITLNGGYGSGLYSEKFGIALNNEMDDFTTRPNEPNSYGLIQGRANKVEPHKRPLSSMSPTLIEKNKKMIGAIGSPGGPRIISGVLQVIYRHLVNGLDIDQAIQAPRIHHQFLPHKLFVESQRWNPDLLNLLKQRGHSVVESWVGKVYMVKTAADGLLESAFDSRSEGAAQGF